MFRNRSASDHVWEQTVGGDRSGFGRDMVTASLALEWGRRRFWAGLCLGLSIGGLIAVWVWL